MEDLIYMEERALAELDAQRDNNYPRTQVAHTIREVNGKYIVIRTTYFDGEPVNHLARIARLNGGRVSWDKNTHDITMGEEVVSQRFDTINEAHDLVTFYENSITWAQVI